MENEYPSISIKQPWAELILQGRKKIELRSWATSYRGSLWLHTGKKYDADLLKYFGFSELFYGGFIGKLKLDLIIPIDKRRWSAMKDRHLEIGPFRSGLYGWVLTNPQRFIKPVPGPGQLKLFFPSPEIINKLKLSEFDSIA